MLLKLRQLGPNRRLVMYLNMRTGLLVAVVLLGLVIAVAMLVMN